MNEKLKSGFVKSLGRGGWLIVALALGCGILLMYLGGNARSGDVVYPSRDIELCTREIEEKIKVMCEHTKGAGETRVAVTLNCSGETVYSSSDGMYGTPQVFLTETSPKISGIGIVCDGGGDPVIRERIISLVSAAWDVPTSRIYVACSEKNTYQS